MAVSLGFMIICGLFLTSDIQFILLAGVVYFAAHAVLLEMFKIYTSGYKRMKKHKRTWQEIFKDRRGWGAMITHLGVIVFFVGVLGNFLNQEKTKTFQVGEKLTIQNYQVHYTGVELKTEKNTQLHIANFQLFKNGKFIQNMQPAKAFYLTSNEPTTEAAIVRFLNEDFYLSLASINPDESATITIYVNPLVTFVPLSFLFFLIGTLLSFSYKSPYFRIEQL